ncbi:hypothetical protein BCR39DRAFT_525633 [Naematelia encephala]|uniref:Uncharacterized protein n=1 Tax=Naematelia encephala TaxID=71784 RepID=A0A1Y2BAQ8_9TREE|nr:hypothetical protein BCR39DRAFT_525633 [Naematelia encephala]
MSIRSLVAGPSRIAQVAPTFLAGSSRVSRRNLTYPHPDLDPSKGTTELYVKFLNKGNTMLDILAVIRAIESKLGPSVFLHVPKDFETLQTSTIFFLHLLRPAQLDRHLLLEVPSPKISRESNHLGGPSLADLMSVLRSNPLDEAGAEGEPPIHVRVEPVPLSGRRKASKELHVQHISSADTPALRAEDKAIVEALRRFEGGFYGGFQGIADDFAHLAGDSATSTVQSISTRTQNTASDRASTRSTSSERSERSSPLTSVTGSPSSSNTPTPKSSEPRPRRPSRAKTSSIPSPELNRDTAQDDEKPKRRRGTKLKQDSTSQTVVEKVLDASLAAAEGEMKVSQETQEAASAVSEKVQQAEGSA